MPASPTDPATDPPTLPAQLARRLLARIRAERLRPGDRMPSEAGIVQELQLSRGTVREAYRTLAALGVVEVGSGRAPRLRRVDAAVIAQVLDYALSTAQLGTENLLDTRRAIELQTAQCAARFATPAQRARLVALAGAMQQAEADDAGRIAADIEIHRLVAEAGGNPLNAILLDALRMPLEAAERLHQSHTRGPQAVRRLIDAHRNVVDRIVAGDAIGAAAAMSYHFDLALDNRAEPAGPPRRPRRR